MQRISRRSFLKTIGLGGLSLALWAPGLHAAAEPIRIGYQAPLSGAFAAFGKWHN
ncbi:MAG TPA: twin-arginine translocation signal domain-containing protein, partial [Candidatus Fraserbacteria bacterium]|nr:twin-arginine translocation signal domain-containing protein [Candidatus Fraserbacteria bacterium]